MSALPCFVLIGGLFMVSTANAECTCGTCVGEGNQYCLKNKVQCQYGDNKNPLLNNNWYHVIGVIGKVIANDKYWKDNTGVTLIKSTIYRVYGPEISRDICLNACDAMSNCKAVEMVCICSMPCPHSRNKS